jgi:hypothetical protein
MCWFAFCLFVYVRCIGKREIENKRPKKKTDDKNEVEIIMFPLPCDFEKFPEKQKKIWTQKAVKCIIVNDLYYCMSRHSVFFWCLCSKIEIFYCL